MTACNPALKAASVLRRLFPILLLSLIIAPGHWVRTPISSTSGAPVTLHEVSDPPMDAELPSGWALEGLWEIRSPDPMYGGLSALLALDGGRFLAFSDRGSRLTFTEPGTQDFSGVFEPMAVDPTHREKLWDIESATTDPATGRFWLGFENTHAIHRFGAEGEIGPVRIIDDEVDWSTNSGAEAMTRLSDGRFIIIPESGGEALIYPSDPISGAEAESIEFVSPLPGFGITDAAQLPDSRLLILMRNLTWDWPPFEARLAIAEIDPAGAMSAINPEVVLDLTAHLPADNYEGLAIRERADGTLDIWVMADDNLSAFQRTLIAKLHFNPVERSPAKPSATQTKQKARE